MFRTSSTISYLPVTPTFFSKNSQWNSDCEPAPPCIVFDKRYVSC
jgi:hypothetical protein